MLNGHESGFDTGEAPCGVMISRVPGVIESGVRRSRRAIRGAIISPIKIAGRSSLAGTKVLNSILLPEMFNIRHV